MRRRKILVVKKENQKKTANTQPTQTTQPTLPASSSSPAGSPPVTLTYKHQRRLTF